jgi:hypothetical protein
MKLSYSFYRNEQKKILSISKDDGHNNNFFAEKATFYNNTSYTFALDKHTVITPVSII